MDHDTREQMEVAQEEMFSNIDEILELITAESEGSDSEVEAAQELNQVGDDVMSDECTLRQKHQRFYQHCLILLQR